MQSLKADSPIWIALFGNVKTIIEEARANAIRSVDYNRVLMYWKTGRRVFEEEQQGSHDEKVFRRELIRLETSLKAAGEHEKLCFLHYPPRYRGYTCPEILELLQRYGVRLCCYGHLHGDSHKLALEGLSGGTEFRLVAADYVNFRPVKLAD